MEIVSNIIVGIAAVICLAAGIWVYGFENGWFDHKEPSDDETVPTDNEEKKENEDDENV